MEGSVGPVQPGGIPPLSTHSVSQEGEAISPQTVAIATQLLHQAMQDVHSMASHHASQLNLPMSQSHEMGSTRVWVR